MFLIKKQAENKIMQEGLAHAVERVLVYEFDSLKHCQAGASHRELENPWQAQYSSVSHVML